MTETESAWMSIADAAPLLDVSEQTSRDWLARDAFPFAQITEKVGGRWKVSRYRLQQYNRGELPRPSAERAS